MLPTECYSCKTDCNKVYQNIIKPKEILLLQLFNLNQDVIKHICSFLFHDSHQIIHRKKSGLSETSGFYWNEIMVLCSKCFHKGIMLSLLRTNNLPRLRGDVNNFLIKEYLHEKKIIDKSYGKHFYPKIFKISMTRSFPLLKDGIFYIKSN